MTTTTAPTIRAPRGNQLRCKGWQQEAALRCLMNNLDPESGRAARGPGRLWRHRQGGAQLGVLSRHRARAGAAGQRGDAAGAVGQAGGGVSHARDGAAGAHRQLQPGGQVGQLGALQRARPQGPDDVWPDDRGKLDLHRHAGHFAGDLSDLCRACGAALWRASSEGQAGGDRRHGRHGRRAAAFRHAQRRRGAGRRSGPQPHRAPRGDALLRLDRRRPGRGAALVRRGAARGPRAVRGTGGQLRRRAAGDGAPRRAGGRGDRPDQRARSAERLHSAGTHAERGRGAAAGAIPRSMCAARRRRWWFT